MAINKRDPKRPHTKAQRHGVRGIISTCRAFFMYSCDVLQCLKRSLLITLLLGCAASLIAQDERFIQRLVWSEDENTMRYEVIIEREDNGRYVSHHQEVTTFSWINVSLPQGSYRYRIIPYNYLNRPGEASPWIPIEIRAALMPELTHITPDTLYLNSKKEYAITIAGKNIEANAEIGLRRPGGVSIVPHTKKVADNGSSAELFFSREQLTPGVYEGYIRNVSGLETMGGVITIASPEEAAALEGKPAFTASRLNTLGASVGTTFAAPLLLATVRGTFAPWRHSFFEAGVDFGFLAMPADVDYFSVYPFVHYAAYIPFAGKFGWYAGVGAGFMIANYNFPEGDIPINTFALDVITGVNVLNFLDISYTLRTGFKGVNHKVAAGYVYRFR